MTEDVESRIRARAHGIWEAEGRPSGRAEAHWHLAAAEVLAAPSGAAARRKRAAPAEAAPSPKKRAARKLEPTA